MIMDAMPGFTFGADPELFVIDGNGEFVTAEGLIPGTKSEPHPVEFGAIQVDGMAAEFNIEPAGNYKEFNHNILAVMKQLKGFLPQGYDLVPVPAVTFTKEMWDKAPDCAKVLGCTPDFNAWTGDVNPPPHDDVNPTLRTASGHLHVGWTEDADMTDMSHVLNCRDLVKQMDWYLGGWSLQQDPDPTRRRLYGKAGAMRFKPYGVEYRVLSNFWLTSSSRRQAVWNRMQKAIWDMRNKYMPDQVAKFTSFDFNDRLIQMINESQWDATLAAKFRFPLKSLETNSIKFGA